MAPDPRVVLAEIKEEVRRRRAAGDYPRTLLDRITATFQLPDERHDPELYAVVDSVRPLHSDRPVIGPAITFTKRTVRRLLAWYVQPIAHEQTEFNLALLRQVRDLEAVVADAAPVWTPSGALATQRLRAAARARAQALLDSGADLSRGVAIVGCDAALRAELARRGVNASTAGVADEQSWVASLARSPQSVLFLAGALGRVNPAESLRIVQLARGALAPYGVLVVDAPIATPSSPLDPGPIDITMRRWVAPESAMLLMELAGLETPRRFDIVVPEDDDSNWYMVIATAPGP